MKFEYINNNRDSPFLRVDVGEEKIDIQPLNFRDRITMHIYVPAGMKYKHGEYIRNSEGEILQGHIVFEMPKESAPIK